MYAAVLTAHGQPPEYRQFADPAPAEDETRVTVRAAPIAPLDLLCASGTSYFGPPALPYVPGVQGVGLLDDGTRVWFTTSAGMAPGDGSMAQLCTPHREDIVPLPDLDAAGDADVAALGLSAIAAWMVLTWRAQLRPGERVLVLGASGIVGQVAVQAAKLLGAAHVTAACRSQAGQQRAAEQGADAVVALDPADDVGTLTERLRAACPAGYDVVVDPIFGVPAAAALRSLADHGRLVHLGSAASLESSFDSFTLRGRSLAILGYTNNAVSPGAKADALRVVLAHVAAGELRVGHRVRELHNVAAAWREQQSGAGGERIVLRCQP